MIQHNFLFQPFVVMCLGYTDTKKSLPPVDVYYPIVHWVVVNGSRVLAVSFQFFSFKASNQQSRKGVSGFLLLQCCLLARAPTSVWPGLAWSGQCCLVWSSLSWPQRRSGHRKFCPMAETTQSGLTSNHQTALPTGPNWPQ